MKSRPEQVLHVAGDVVLQQVGPLLDPHLGELLGGEVGQLVARLVDRVDLELLLGLVGDVAGQGDQVASACSAASKTGVTVTRR